MARSNHVIPFSIYSLRFFQMRAVFVFLTTLIFSSGLYAQLPSSRPVILLDQQNGLIHHSNYFMFKDSRDIVWISSNMGIYLYDGTNLELRLPEDSDQASFNINAIHSNICEDSKSNIWFGTWQGISSYIRDQDTFRNFSLPNTELLSRFFVIGLDSFNQVWFTHSDGIYTLGVEDGIVKYQADFSAHLWNSELQLDANGHVKRIFSYNRYIGFPGLYIHEFDSSGFTQSFSILKPPDTDALAVTDVQLISDSILLVSTSDGLFRYNLNKNTLRKFMPEALSGQWSVNALATLSDSLVLVGTKNGEYYTFNTNQLTFSNHHNINNKGTKLSEPAITMYQDPDKGIWIHLGTKGIAYYHPENIFFHQYPIKYRGEDQTVQINANCIVENDNGNIIALTETTGTFFVPIQKGVPSGNIIRCNNCPSESTTANRDSHGRIWLKSSQQLYRLLTSGEILKIITPTKVSSNRIAELEDGRIIIAGQGKLLISDKGESPTSFSILELTQYPKYYFLEPFVSPNGLIYVSASKIDSSQISLLVIDPKSGYDIIHEIRIPGGIQTIQFITGSDDFLLGTKQAIYYFHAKNDFFEKINCTHCNDRLNLWNIIPVEKELYMLCCESNVFLVNISTLQSWRFGYEHGLGLSGVNWFGHLKHSDGNIWLANDSGIALWRPQNLNVKSPHSLVIFTDIRINDKYSIHDLRDPKMVFNPNEVERIDLPHSRNTLTINFSSISYAGINECVFEYRLKGLEKDWVDGEKIGIARYVSLPTGKYTFEVRIKNNIESVRFIPIHVIPPFYLRGWFIILGLITAFVFAILLLRVRERRKEKIMQLIYERKLALEHERLRISNNLHDDLGSSLSAINLRTKIVSDLAKDPDIKSQLDEISLAATRMTQKIREIIWTTNSANDTVDNLITHLHQYALEYFKDSGIFVTIHLPTERSSHSIDGSDRREIYLAYREALHNILKHSQAKHVTITILLNLSGVLTITIRDNGIGLDASSNKNTSSHGLKSMLHRMHQIDGLFEIHSMQNGTEVKLTYKIRP